MSQSWKNFSIGLITSCAIGIVVVVFLFLHPKYGDAGQVLRVRFANIEKVGVGTKVTYAGRPIGEVIAMRMVPSHREREEQEQHPIFSYELVLAVDSHVLLYSCDDIQVRTTGLMGEKTIAITPQYAKKNEIVKRLENNDLAYATTATGVEDTFQGINNVTKKAEKTLNELYTFIKKVNDKDLSGSLVATLNTINTSAEKIDHILNSVTEQQGTIGRLFYSNDFYLQMQGILARLDTMMSDVNHYGILFHLDKSWQRERRRRVLALEELRTPKEFQNYLHEELGKIRTSIDRVGMAMHRDPQQKDLIANVSEMDREEFLASYRELLERVQILGNTLKNLEYTQLNTTSTTEVK